ncbi:MAG: DNA translocase FtsK 4TM domain-containing protein [Deltaproteobacteria bacterium]
MKNTGSNKKPKNKQIKKVHAQTLENAAAKRLSQSVIGILIIFSAVLFFVCMFMTPESGPFGAFVKELLLGFFGPAGFIAVFVVFYLGWNIVVGNSRNIKRKTVSAVVILILVSCLLYLFDTHGIYNTEYDFTTNVQNFYSAGKEMMGGGVIGGMLTVPLVLVFGGIGAGIILFAVFAVILIVITGSHPVDMILVLKGIGINLRNVFSQKPKVKAHAHVKEIYKNEQDIEEKPVSKARKPFDIQGIQQLEQEFGSEIQEETNMKKVKATAKKIKADEDMNFEPKGKQQKAVEEINLEHNAIEKTDNDYIFPSLEILKPPANIDNSGSKRDVKDTAIKLEETLSSFGVKAKVINVSRGPTVTRYELSPGAGVKVSKIVGLADDLALNLAASAVRIEAPIPGKAAVGIEIPNKEVSAVYLREIIESREFKNYPSNLAFSIGKDIGGKVVVGDIARMPHLLIAGATGSGKSVCINTLIASILYKARPDQVKMLMIDPKVVELGVYNGIPHLLIPVVTDPKKAAGALNWAVQEMISRYNLFAEKGVRDLKGYNAVMQEQGAGSTLPQIMIIIDELADLMMVAPNDVEDAICRLAQMARAAGMHLIIATQRPSVDVITGVIKANIPSRISFAVSSQIDSRTILDSAGAEKLLGKGDMLYYPVGEPKPIRLQGTFISDKEVEGIVEFVKTQEQVSYNEDIIEKLESESVQGEPDPGDNDVLLPQVADMIVDTGQASISIIQRRFKVGYARAARLIDQLEARGIIGGFEGSKPRRVLMSKQQWEEMKEIEVE